MDLILQAWGGFFYFLNKALFALSETRQHEIKQKFRLIAWACYLIGVPAWAVLLIGKSNWIAASIEVGGIPAMLLGLYKTVSASRANPFIELAVKYTTYLVIIFGITLSIQHHGGISSLSQWLEVGITFGFLMGSYLMTQNNPNAYLCFITMNVCMGLLMFINDKNILMIQQLFSLSFVIYGYVQSKTHSRL